MSNRPNTTVCLAALITTMGVGHAVLGSGDGDGDGGGGSLLRVALLQAGGAGTVDFEITELVDGSRENQLAVTGGCMLMMGFDAADAARTLTLDILDGSSVTLHTLGTDASEDDSFEVGTHVVSLAEGGTQLVGDLAGLLGGSITVSWTEEANSDTDAYLGLADFEIIGGSVSYHPSQDQEWLWFHGAGEPVAQSTVRLQAIGGDAEASMIWVGDVTSGTSFTLPAEGSDESAVALTEGFHDVFIGSGGLFAVRLGAPDSDEGGSGDGGDGGGCVADLDGNGSVDGADLTILLGSWGVCP